MDKSVHGSLLIAMNHEQKKAQTLTLQEFEPF